MSGCKENTQVWVSETHDWVLREVVTEWLGKILIDLDGGDIFSLKFLKVIKGIQGKKGDITLYILD